MGLTIRLERSRFWCRKAARRGGPQRLRMRKIVGATGIYGRTLAVYTWSIRRLDHSPEPATLHRQH